jgi:hypothetical protein
LEHDEQRVLRLRCKDVVQLRKLLGIALECFATILLVLKPGLRARVEGREVEAGPLGATTNSSAFTFA